MSVHSTPADALERDMDDRTSPETLPIDAGDAAWVADLFDTLHSGDVDAVADELNELVCVMRKAAKARRILAAVKPDLLREGLEVLAARRGDPR